MKKILIFIAATIILILSSVLCACTNTDVNIENTNWKLQVAIRANIENQESEVIARNEFWIVEDTNIPVVDIILVAKDGIITIMDSTDTNKSFSGTYKKVDVIDVETIVYQVTISELSGTANVSTTKYNDGRKTKTLIFTLLKNDIQYTLNFISN